MNNKGFVNIALIGIVVILLGIGGYFVWSEYGPQPCAQSLLPSEAVNKKTGEKKIFEYPCAVPRGWVITDYHPATTPQPTSIPTPQQPSPTPTNETTSWKTYKNDTYSFELKYPSDWASKGSWSENGGFFYVAFGVANSIDSKPLATLRVYPNQTTLDKFIKYFDYVGGTWKNVSLGGVAAKEVVSTGQNSKQFILTASVKNSYGFELASTVFGDNVDTVRKMNLTFQFLK
ncbi:MAG: hypothetical protein HYT37_01110 [Candidatus Sungbacteria bacterium]|nr:hypothetical protein [Candidatus Sungbacteria bacterium]